MSPNHAESDFYLARIFCSFQFAPYSHNDTSFFRKLDNRIREEIRAAEQHFCAKKIQQFRQQTATFNVKCARCGGRNPRSVVANKRLFMRDCSTCRDSRGLITRTRCSSPPPTFIPRGEGVETGRVCGEPQTRDAMARPSAQSAGSIDSRFLRRDRDCLCREIKLALFCASEDRSYPARANCAASRRDKLRAYKCSIRRRRRLIVRCARSLSYGRFEHRRHHLEDAIARGN